MEYNWKSEHRNLSSLAGIFPGNQGVEIYVYNKFNIREKSTWVIFILMNNNTILNIIWISFTNIGIQRHFTKIISKVIFQLIMQWRNRGRAQHCSVYFTQIFLFSLQVPFTQLLFFQRRILAVKRSQCIEEEC